MAEEFGGLEPTLLKYGLRPLEDREPPPDVLEWTTEDPAETAFRRLQVAQCIATDIIINGDNDKVRLEAMSVLVRLDKRMSERMGWDAPKRVQGQFVTAHVDTAAPSFRVVNTQSDYATALEGIGDERSQSNAPALPDNPADG